MIRFAVAGLTLAFATSAVQADSIWDRRDPRAAYLFQDNRARNVGDILTIAITENTTNNDREQRSGDRRTRNDYTGTMTGSFQIGNAPGGAGNVTGNSTTDGRRRFDGSAQMTASRTFTDRMGVTIVDVLPNGNLVFEGTRTRVIAGEERQLRVTGVVRPADIGAGNTIQSQFVANFRVSYLGRGQQTEFTKQPLLGRIMNYILP